MRTAPTSSGRSSSAPRTHPIKMHRSSLTGCSIPIFPKAHPLHTSSAGLMGTAGSIRRYICLVCSLSTYAIHKEPLRRRQSLPFHPRHLGRRPERNMERCSVIPSTSFCFDPRPRTREGALVLRTGFRQIAGDRRRNDQ